MISLGIDVSKGKSTICMLKPYGEIVDSVLGLAHLLEHIMPGITAVLTG